jgi:tRNA A-37 threonylcarbamoyl transferase component Bud32
MLWWIWPTAIDPLSAMLSRSVLFNRLPTVPPILPAIIDIDQINRPQGALRQEASTLGYHRLLAQVMADGPAVIAVVDIDSAAALLNGLTAVDATPQAATVLLPTGIAQQLSQTNSLNIAPNQIIGLRAPKGTLRFNVIANTSSVTDTDEPARVSSLGLAQPDSEPPPSALVQAVVSQYRAVMPDVKANDSRRASRSLGWTPKTITRFASEFIVTGNHRQFFDAYPASTFLNGGIPRGTLNKRIVLLGKMSGKRVGAERRTSPATRPATATAIRVWAALNGQLAHHPQWLLWVECGLVLIVSLFPSVLLRHYAMPVVWMVIGAITCTLAAGAAATWQLRGLMVLPGAAILALVLNSLNASLFIRSHRVRPANITADDRSFAAKPLAVPPREIAATARRESNPTVPDRPETGHQAQAMRLSLENLTEAGSSQEKIGRYEILRCIGKGAMGKVFLGLDPHINRLTAIKTLRFEDNFVEDEIEDVRKKFFREAESAGTLSHANIVTIYDAGEDREQVYIAMEYLEGVTLARFTKAKRLLSASKIIDYGIQIANALDYAHQKGIVHRDIKPANIMVDQNGEIKITDFGIARITATSNTQTGVVKGTPFYMSPEQFSGTKVDGRSDIFSFGTLLFQLLTGTLPFFSESPAKLMNQIMNFPHPNPRAINPRAIPAIVAIVDKALEKDRGQRYQRAAHLAADLTHLKNRIARHRQRQKLG